jgi:hypothetical protein
MGYEKEESRLLSKFLFLKSDPTSHPQSTSYSWEDSIANLRWILIILSWRAPTIHLLSLLPIPNSLAWTAVYSARYARNLSLGQ